MITVWNCSSVLPLGTSTTANSIASARTRANTRNNNKARVSNSDRARASAGNSTNNRANTSNRARAWDKLQTFSHPCNGCMKFISRISHAILIVRKEVLHSYGTFHPRSTLHQHLCDIN